MSSSDVGVTVHFLGSMTLHLRPNATAFTRTVNYGDEVVLTDEVIEANRDCRGRVAILELLDDEQAQIQKYGKRLFAPGPWRELNRIQPGSAAWDDARDRERTAALALPSEDERRIALARVREVYGMPSSAKSRTVAVYDR
jgi:hypothetical protein